MGDPPAPAVTDGGSEQGTFHSTIPSGCSLQRTPSLVDMRQAQISRSHITCFRLLNLLTSLLLTGLGAM